MLAPTKQMTAKLGNMALGMRKQATIINTRMTILGPQYPFWTTPRLSEEDFTPIISKARNAWKTIRASTTRYTAYGPEHLPSGHSNSNQGNFSNNSSNQSVTIVQANNETKKKMAAYVARVAVEDVQAPVLPHRRQAADVQQQQNKLGIQLTRALIFFD
eukprot:Lithocolla_globosa_v1_NODE_4002_length_1531_cov_20.326558.p2 type:complete len:159 gc:universal NODE_4002_length_1531_cov_20.326558:558-82(-)